MSNGNKLKTKEVKEKPSYTNPANTIWGKIVIWTLLIGLVGGVIVALIVALMNL